MDCNFSHPAILGAIPLAKPKAVLQPKVVPPPKVAPAPVPAMVPELVDLRTHDRDDDAKSVRSSERVEDNFFSDTMEHLHKYLHSARRMRRSPTRSRSPRR